MSGSQDGHGSAADASQPENHNQENMLTRLRGSLKNRVDNQENIVPKGANRTVLGGLQINQRSKPQNQRGTKQVGI